MTPILVAGYTFYQVNFYDSQWKNIPPGECLMIMGAKVLANGQPDLMMAERISTAKEIINDDIKKVILSGGSLDDKKTEAEVMSDLLIDSGLDANKVVLETDSTSTLENLAFSKPLILTNNCKKLDILSHDFHLARIAMTADRLGIPINRLIPAQTAKQNTKQRLEREYKAYLWYWLAWDWMVN